MTITQAEKMHAVAIAKLIMQAKASFCCSVIVIVPFIYCTCIVARRMRFVNPLFRRLTSKQRLDLNKRPGP